MRHYPSIHLVFAACCLPAASALIHGAEPVTIKIDGLPPGYAIIGTRHAGNTVIAEVGPVDAAARAAAAPEVPKTDTQPERALSGGSGPSQGVAEKLLDGAALDLSIDAVPAFLALDLTPETVDSPSTPREFAAALINGVDKQGVLHNGIAIEFAPLRTLGLLQINHDQYQSDTLMRLLYNTSLSVATSKASEGEKDVQLAVGLRTILFESANRDPWRYQPLIDAFRGGGAPKPQADLSNLPEETDAPTSFLAAIDEFRGQQWEGAVWSAAIAPIWSSQDGGLSGLDSQGFTAWTTAAYGFKGPLFGGKVQLLGQLRYRADEWVTDAQNNAKTAEQDSLIAAARLRIGQPEFNAFAEGAYISIWDGLEGDGNAWRAAGGLEKRIARNIWLVLSAGQQFGDAGGADEFFAVGSLRFGTSQEATMGGQ